MNRNETRKLNTITQKVVQLIADYKAINNPAYIHLSELHDNLVDLGKEGNIELTTGKQVNLSSVAEQIRLIANKNGNPKFNLECTFNSQGGFEFLLTVTPLFTLDKDRAEKYIWPSNRSSVVSLIEDATTFFEAHYKDFLERNANVAEVVMEEEIKEVANG